MWSTTRQCLSQSELYKNKGAENEELVNEQTYTFTDRGGREVTLGPEMTPTVARMVAGRGATWASLCDSIRSQMCLDTNGRSAAGCASTGSSISISLALSLCRRCRGDGGFACNHA
jgi:hypothetical protein